MGGLDTLACGLSYWAILFDGGVVTAPACCCDAELWLLLLPEPVKDDRNPDARDDAEGWPVLELLPFAPVCPPCEYARPLLPAC